MDRLKNIHIGKIIKDKVNKRKISVAEFARRINCERATVYYIFTQKSIDIERLIRISEVLEYDFITEIYLPENKNPHQKEFICPYFQNP
jgi:transcriptional regulator with XRE-family HTH domain